MSQNALSSMLMIVLIILIVLLIGLSVAYLVIKMKKDKKEKKPSETVATNSKQKKNTKTENTGYNKQSIFDFMEFDKVEDNMIVQKEGKRYLMVIECQGVNYDLMSQMEKVSVEEGFQQFLNTLRHPVQIYIQTRSINLENSIESYKDRVKLIEDQYNKMLFEYNKMKDSDMYTKQQVDAYFYHITKQKNLLDYGKDIVTNTEKMSLNKNVLNRRYYIVIPYFSEEIGNEQYDKEEIKNMAFSELYTKAQAIIRTLSSCSVNGKVLNSNELVELLYIAYNREDAETFNLNKALKAQYDSLYSTAPDVFEKKIRILDQQISDQAVDLANVAVQRAKTKLQEKAEEKEENLEELVKKMAEIILSDNKDYVGEEIANKAIEEIEKGGQTDEKEVKKSTRGRKKKSISE